MVDLAFGRYTSWGFLRSRWKLWIFFGEITSLTGAEIEMGAGRGPKRASQCRTWPSHTGRRHWTCPWWSGSWFFRSQWKLWIFLNHFLNWYDIQVVTCPLRLGKIYSCRQGCNVPIAIAIFASYYALWRKKSANLNILLLWKKLYSKFSYLLLPVTSRHVMYITSPKR